MSRVLIWSPNYAPELTGIPPLVTDAAEWLASQGHSIEVVAPMPNYPERRIHDTYRGRLWLTERRGDVVVHRSWLRVRPEERFLDKALYELTVSTVALRHVLARLRHVDVVLCVVPTLLAAAYATALPLRARVVLWVQDLVVRAAETVDVPWAAHGVLNVASSIERRAVRRADRVVVCSPGFRDHLVARGADPRRLDVVYNWVDLDWIVPTPIVPHDGPLRALYAGNLGYTQGLETLVEAARICGSSVQVDIVGEGNAARHVAALATTLDNVRVREPVPRDAYPALLAAHDVDVVVQRRVGAGANLPSKIASYLGSGRPVIGSIDHSTPAARLLEESGGALLIEPESPRALAAALERMRADPGLRAKLGGQARAFAERRLSKESALRALEDALLV